MKRNIIIGVITMFTISLVVVLLIKKPPSPLRIISNHQTISIYHSDQSDRITIELLTNQPKTYYFDQEYISFTSLVNESEEVSLDLEDIYTHTEPYIYEGEEYFLVEFLFKLPFEASNHIVKLNDASLMIDYSNGEEISAYVGEFNYVMTNHKHKLTLSNLSATHEEINGVNTLGGVNLSLKNNATRTIVIKNIDIVSENIHFSFNDSVLREECLYDKKTSECLQSDTFSRHTYEEPIKEVILNMNQNLDIYLPIVYLNDTDYIYRFSIVVTYSEYGTNEIKEYYIDDFPFMASSIYQESMEASYKTYEHTNQNQ